MALPLQFAQLQTPQVITGTGAPDALETILAAIMQGQQFGARGVEEAGRNSRSSAELDQRRQEFELQKTAMGLELADKKIALENEKAKGEALKVLLPYLIQTGQLSPGATQGGMQGGPGGAMQQGMQAPVQQPGGLPAVGMTPSAPSEPVRAYQGPLHAFSGVIQGLPAAVIPGFVQHYAGLAEKAQGKADRIQGIERAIASVDPSKQAGTRTLLMLTEIGGNLPKEILATLVPSLFGTGSGEIDPARANAFTTLFRTGVFTAGQAARQVGLPLASGIDPGAKFEPFPTRPRNEQLKAGAQMSVMQAAIPILDAYSQKQAPGPLTSFIKAGGKGSFRELVANPLLSDEDRQFIQAARQFSDSWAFIISGAATAEQQFGRIFGSIIESYGDDAGTRQQKRNMRSIMVQSVSDIAGGAITPTQAIDRALKLDWSPEQKRFLVEERQKAIKHEADKQAGKAKYQGQGPVGDPDDFEERMAQIEAMLRNP